MGEGWRGGMIGRGLSRGFEGRVSGGRRLENR